MRGSIVGSSGTVESVALVLALALALVRMGMGWFMLGNIVVAVMVAAIGVAVAVVVAAVVAIVVAGALHEGRPWSTTALAFALAVDTMGGDRFVRVVVAGVVVAGVVVVAVVAAVAAVALAVPAGS